MAPTSKSPPSAGGDAKLNIAAMNSISMLMASRFKPDPSLLARKPTASLSSKSTTTDISSSKHRLAQAEALELEHLAGFDDNWGVGMVRPASEIAAQRAKQKEERKLKLKLLGKRKADEEAREKRLRDVDSSSGEEESRAAVGRAKKRVRRDAVEHGGQMKKDRVEMEEVPGDVGMHNHAEARNDDLQMGRAEEETPEEALRTKTDARPKTNVEDGDQVIDEDGSSKKKHKKKKKKKKQNLAGQTNQETD